MQHKNPVFLKHLAQLHNLGLLTKVLQLDKEHWLSVHQSLGPKRPGGKPCAIVGIAMINCALHVPFCSRYGWDSAGGKGQKTLQTKKNSYYFAYKPVTSMHYSWTRQQM